jgi:hypothetical protein
MLLFSSPVSCFPLMVPLILEFQSVNGALEYSALTEPPWSMIPFSFWWSLCFLCSPRNRLGSFWDQVITTIQLPIYWEAYQRGWYCCYCRLQEVCLETKSNFSEFSPCSTHLSLLLLTEQGGLFPQWGLSGNG